jgi:hypothetical protein
VISSPFFAARNGEDLATEEECAAAPRSCLKHENGNSSKNRTALTNFLPRSTEETAAD